MLSSNALRLADTLCQRAIPNSFSESIGIRHLVDLAGLPPSILMTAIDELSGYGLILIDYAEERLGPQIPKELRQISGVQVLKAMDVFLERLAQPSA